MPDDRLDDPRDRNAERPVGDRQLETGAYHIWKPRPLLRSIEWWPDPRPPASTTRGAYQVFFDQRVFEAMHRHVWHAGAGEEPFGYLVGDLCEDPDSNTRYLLVSRAIPSRFPFRETARNQVSAEARVALQLEVDRHRGVLAGWYHRHVEGAVELGSEDVDTHRRLFDEPWQTAVLFVTDAEAPRGGVFRRTPEGFDGTLPLPFHEMVTNESLRARGIRRTRLDWENLVTDDPVERDPPERPAVAATPEAATGMAEVSGGRPAATEPELSEAEEASAEPGAAAEGQDASPEAGGAGEAAEVPSQPGTAGRPAVDLSEVEPPGSAEDRLDGDPGLDFDAIAAEVAEAELDVGTPADSEEGRDAAAPGGPEDRIEPPEAPEPAEAEEIGPEPPAGEERAPQGEIEAAAAPEAGEEEGAVMAGPPGKPAETGRPELLAAMLRAIGGTPEPAVEEEETGTQAGAAAEEPLEEPAAGLKEAEAAGEWGEDEWPTPAPRRRLPLRETLMYGGTFLVALAVVASLVIFVVQTGEGGGMFGGPEQEAAPAATDGPPPRATPGVDGAPTETPAGTNGPGTAVDGRPLTAGGEERAVGAETRSAAAGQANGAGPSGEAAAGAPEIGLDRFEALGEGMLESISRFYGRAVAYEQGRVGCEAVQEAYVEVEDRWITYNVEGRARLTGRLPDELQARDERLYRGVQDVEREFARTGCPRP